MIGAAQLPKGRRLAAFGSHKALRTLEAVEREVAHHLPPQQGSPPLRKIGDWVVRRDLLLARALGPPTARASRPEWEASIAPLRGRVTALLSGLRSRAIPSTARADAALFHSHLRAFYGGPRPLTLWIGLGKGSAPDLAGAAHAREQFGAPPGIRVPRVIQADLAAQPPYLLEELVIGRPFASSDWPVLSERLLPALFAYYETTGVRQHAASDFYDRERLIAPFLAMRSASTSKGRRRDLDELLEVASEWLQPNPMLVPVALGHGDLSKSNLLVAPDGALVVLDWERARRLPLAGDLIKLVQQHPPLRPQVEGLLASVTDTARGLSPVAQLRLAALDTLSRYAAWATKEGWGVLARSSRLQKAKRVRAWMRFVRGLADGPRASSGATFA